MEEQKKRRGRPPGSKNKSYSEKLEKAAEEENAKKRLRDEIFSIVIMAIGVFLVIAFQTKAAGQFGLLLSNVLKGVFGAVAYILPYYLILYGVLLFLKRTQHINGRSILFVTLIFMMLAILNSVSYLDSSVKWSVEFLKNSFADGVHLKSGGMLGMAFGFLLKKAFGIPGLVIMCLAVIIISALLVINTPLSYFTKGWRRRFGSLKIKDEADSIGIDLSHADNKETTESYKVQPSIKAAISPGQMKIIDYMKDDQLFDEAAGAEEGKGLTDNTAEDQKPKDALKEEELKINPSQTIASYKIPSVDLLSKAPSEGRFTDTGNLKSKAIKLEKTLQSFGVSAKVLQVTKGPAITRYEIQPDIGVKVASIVRLADDIALNLEAKSIRIEAPIPGKAAVGVEVENERINLVAVRDIIESREFRNTKSKISFAVGKNISGDAIVADLKDMPHLLIAGSTGSGKSVCLNALIVSILYRARPDEVKFVLVDPKVVELGNYNGIPHLLVPVVTEPSKAAAALGWAVSEMTERYRKFAEEGAKDLESFNKAKKSKSEMDLILPQIVIIIDELADLMMVAPSQVEESICRLAQMARAAGMHLIVATQRPSVDVITGVIKANIPSRISFAVSSQFDSRTILDMAGAERLVGKGDMLFNPLGISKPVRVQGAFISDTEVHRVIDYIKRQVPENEYAEDVLNCIEKPLGEGREYDKDELLPDAIKTVIRAEQASVSMLQRRFRIGYNRAARLVDMMEQRGIVGPSDGSRPRKVLVTEEQYQESSENPDN